MTHTYDIEVTPDGVVQRTPIVAENMLGVLDEVRRILSQPGVAEQARKLTITRRDA